MAIDSSYQHDHGMLHLSDSLIYSEGPEFRRHLNRLINASIRTLAIDLQHLTYMDSSGLGMLLVAGNECRTHSIALTLHRPTGTIESLLRLTNCYERFTVTE